MVPHPPHHIPRPGQPWNPVDQNGFPVDQNGFPIDLSGFPVDQDGFPIDSDPANLPGEGSPDDNGQPQPGQPNNGGGYPTNEQPPPPPAQPIHENGYPTNEQPPAQPNYGGGYAANVRPEQPANNDNSNSGTGYSTNENPVAQPAPAPPAVAPPAQQNQGYPTSPDNNAGVQPNAAVPADDYSQDGYPANRRMWPYSLEDEEVNEEASSQPKDTPDKAQEYPANSGSWPSWKRWFTAPVVRWV
ncbi:hypothetical protein T440DRAFT_550217 [Plenodomus tracheiphilus IPT5]|uniref:Uncharacterized protein n=1 Tax=Plenodomus tracheiphilus IPT5 TaxID=1408161 RepID=A0A6A7BN77_9PLEO|nr:hypothetical protein T440DRAFT_550217 [Plenodomus tracheiphilus IPT5]